MLPFILIHYSPLFILKIFRKVTENTMNTRISSVHRVKFWMYFCRSMAVMSLLDHLSRISSELWRFYQHPSHFLLIQLYQEWPKTGTGWTITWDVNYPREGRNSFLQEIWKQFWSMPINGNTQFLSNTFWTWSGENSSYVIVF